MSHATLQTVCWDSRKKSLFLSLPHYHVYWYQHCCAMMCAVVWLLFVPSAVGMTTTTVSYDTNSECYTETNGADYRGSLSTTETGKTCQKWTSQTPHGHDRTPANYPHYSGLGDHNYCRNPDDETQPWCYTTDSNVRWEFCDVGNPQTSCIVKDNVRLVNSPFTYDGPDGGYYVYDNEGIVEIQDPVEGKWGPLCGWGIGHNEANVICRQLGYSKLSIEYFSDGAALYNTDYYNAYGGYVYLGLKCDGDKEQVAECSYDSHRGSLQACHQGWDLVAAVHCNGEKDVGSSSLDLGYWSFIVIIIVVAAAIHGLRQCGDRRRCLTTCPCSSQPAPSQTPQEVLAAANVYPSPPAVSDSTAYHQVPTADLPPGYDACVTPPQSQDVAVPYPPPHEGTPYPPQSDSNGIAYPPPSTNPALPPLDITNNPAFPPPESCYQPNSEVPMTPPPSYDSITTSGRFDTGPSDSGGGSGGGGGGGGDSGGGGGSDD